MWGLLMSISGRLWFALRTLTKIKSHCSGASHLKIPSSQAQLILALLQFETTAV